MSPVLHTALRFGLLTALYLGGTWLAVWFVESDGQVTLIWPSAGLAFAALLLYGLRWWPFIAAAIVLQQFVLPPMPWAFVPFSIAANTLGIVAGVALVRRFAPEATGRLDVRSGFVLLAGGAIAVLVGTPLGVAGLLQVGFIQAADVPSALARWALANLFGLVAITPAVLLVIARLRTSGSDPARPRRGALETGLWLGSMLAVLALVYWAARESGAYAIGLASLPLALMMWSAQRFSPLFTAVATALLALLVAMVLGLGIGGFPRPQGLLDSSILLAFLCLMALVPQVLAAATFDNQQTALRMLRRASTDPLTGLPNRGAFEGTVRSALREHGDETMALAYLDLDQFKLVNDTVSHAAGDQMLRALSGALRTALEPDDVLARISGDEFAVLLRRTGPQRGQRRAEQLRAAVADFRFASDGHVLAPTVSIGLVPFVAREAAFDRLLADADAACFTAKERGGNRTEVLTPGTGDVAAHTAAMRWAVRLNAALDHDHFQLYCQTIAPLADGAAEGRQFELLLRLHDPASGRLLMPGEFVPAAERFKLGQRLDAHVLARTLDWFAAHPQHAREVARCSINLTAASVQHDDLLGRLERLLRNGGLQPQQLCFEITETSAVRDLARARRFIATLRGLGCRVALDDFGSGFCSFGYLDQLEVDVLKIDGGFVRNMQDSALSMAVVRAIADIARVQRCRTVAECAETPAVLDRLRALGVDYAQGYAIHRPERIDRYFASAAAATTDTAQPTASSAH